MSRFRVDARYNTITIEGDYFTARHTVVLPFIPFAGLTLAFDVPDGGWFQLSVSPSIFWAVDDEIWVVDLTDLYSDSGAFEGHFYHRERQEDGSRKLVRCDDSECDDKQCDVYFAQNSLMEVFSAIGWQVKLR